jgi:hypothetical protein
MERIFANISETSLREAVDLVEVDKGKPVYPREIAMVMRRLGFKRAETSIHHKGGHDEWNTIYRRDPT